MIKLVLFTGLRSTELLNIRYEDITPKEDLYKITVVGKGNKLREVFIHKKHLEDYLNTKYLNRRTRDLVFRNFNGKKLSQAYISRAVDKVLTMARINKEKKGTHLLRHTFATQLYRKTKDVFLLKEALGHSDINTSMIYTHLDKHVLEKVTDLMDDLI
jgi:integrase/recombinase XerD